MNFEDLPPYWQDYFGEHWNERAQEAWHDDIQNFIDAFDSSQYLWLGSHAEGDLNDILQPDSDFSVAYAAWADTGFDRDDRSYADMLYEADYFEDRESAYSHYDMA